MPYAGTADVPNDKLPKQGSETRALPSHQSDCGHHDITTTQSLQKLKTSSLLHRLYGALACAPKTIKIEYPPSQRMLLSRLLNSFPKLSQFSDKLYFPTTNNCKRRERCRLKPRALLNSTKIESLLSQRMLLGCLHRDLCDFDILPRT